MKLSGIEGVNPDVERKIRQSINEAEMMGWTIVPLITYSAKHRMCCALGTVMARNILLSSSLVKCGWELGLNSDEAFDFVHGFDGDTEQRNRPYYKLGKLMGKEYQDK